MKLKNFFATLLGLLFANGCGALMPVFAAEPATKIEANTNALAASTNFFTADADKIACGAGNLRLLASALQNQQMNIDVIANNLANVNTTGFKLSRLQFQDMPCKTMKRAGSPQPGGNQLPASLQVGQGATPVAITRVFTQGEMSKTGNNFDVAIQGNGFFEVQMPDGSLAFTRDGGFKTDGQGRIVTAEGYPVISFQTVSAGVTGVTIAAGGQVTYAASGSTVYYQMQLARFVNPGGLDAIGHNLFKQTESSGTPERGNPAENGFGELQQGFLELSNVNAEQERVNLFLAQRDYYAISKAMQLTEKMLQ